MTDLKDMYPEDWTYKLLEDIREEELLKKIEKLKKSNEKRR